MPLVANSFGSEQRLKLFIYGRILVSFLFLVSAYFIKYQDSIVESDRYQSGVVRLMAFSFLFSLISLSLLRQHKITSFLTYLQVIWDLLFVTVLLLFTGGILSPYSFLYLLSIMIAGMLLGRRQALYTASLCGILYGAILDFQYFGYLAFIGLSQSDAFQVGALRLFYTISFNLIAFGLTAFITGLLAERARLSEEALERSSIDYFELSQLNSAIVTHSESGLLTTTVTGRVRVFNPYSELITGLSQSDAYDRNIDFIFPQLAVCFNQNSILPKIEFEYEGATGKKIILSFNMASFNDSDGKLCGFIVSFRDITGMRLMEAALKKADRLAALGELSARMAHEIRNPLAALCGSVQLLSNATYIKANDAQLLSIVNREAERLEALITEFLMYARPSNPVISEVSLHMFIEGELSFFEKNIRFMPIKMKNMVPESIKIAIDSNQIHQVFLNLLQNAAEAMIGDNREIVVEASSTPELLTISITDNGIGISQESQQHLFEPFWTTKPEGTGLGLAICYRIIEAHGGVLSVESPPDGGCRFLIKLPYNNQADV